MFVVSSGFLTVNSDGFVYILVEEVCEFFDLDVNVSINIGNVYVYKFWFYGFLFFMRIYGLKFFLYICIIIIYVNFEIEFFWYRIVFSNSS